VAVGQPRLTSAQLYAVSDVYQVPDRGGRAYELGPPPRDMPSFQQRRGGPPGHRGGGGGKQRNRGGVQLLYCNFCDYKYGIVRAKGCSCHAFYNYVANSWLLRG